MAAPWYLLSWVTLGGFVPETFFIKKEGGGWGSLTFANGLTLYLDRYPLEMILACVPALAAIGIVAARLRATKPVVWLLLGLAGTHFAAYSLLGVAPHHWYYSTSIMLLQAALLVGAQDVPLFRLRAAVATVWFAGCVYVMGAAVVQREMPIHSNWTRTEEYKRLAWTLSELVHGAPLGLEGELGAVQYWYEGNLINEFSRRPDAAQTTNGHAAMGLFRRISAFHAARLRAPQGTQPSYSVKMHRCEDIEASTHVIFEAAGSKWRPDRLCILLE